MREINSIIIIIIIIIIARNGLPDVIRSENEPPFNGKEFGDFAENLGITQRRVAPLYGLMPMDK